MKLLYKIVKDLFNISLITWFILVMLELSKNGSVQRFINLEYYLYFLTFLFISYKILSKYFFDFVPAKRAMFINH